ncbi:MAG: SusC/RagA family TonB-linked outer membrane protein [Kofleriaceae bacterium]
MRWAIVSLVALWFILPADALAQTPGNREISGTIVDAESRPIANATIAVTGGGPATTTGADGSFKLTVAAANLTLDITAEGFTTRQATVLGARSPLQLQLVLLRPTPPPPPETRAIAGVVTDGQRAPVPNATVRVRGTELSAVTAEDGTFSIPGVAVTDVVLDIEATGQPAAQLAVPATKATVVIAMGAGAPPPPATRRVTGKVLDPVSGEPVVAAEITVKATGEVLFSDGDGAFVVDNVPEGPLALDVSAPERESRVLEVAAGQTTISVPLALVQGEQIVIEGRAPVITKSSLASGASVVDDKELNRVTAATVDSALQGKLAGANLQFNSGAPGGGAQLRLRGISTINGQSSPLYVIDGVVVSNVAVPSGSNAITGAAAGGSASNQDNPVNRIADLNPNDIEQIEVLKGASAAALYGSKASNGVVIITTKRGRNGENRVEVTQRVGVSQRSNKLGSRRFESLQEVQEAFDNSPSMVQAYQDAGGRTFDHEDEITRTPISWETLASASGGTDKANYYGSMLVRDDPGIVIGTFYEKQSGRLSLGYKLGDRLRLGLTANLLHSTSDRGLTNNDNSGTSYYVVLSGTPNFVNFNPRNGIYPANPAVGSGTNLLQSVSLLENREDVWRLIGGSTAALDLYKDAANDVKLLGNFGVDSFDQKNNLLSPNELIYEPRLDGLAGTAIDATTRNLNWNVGAGATWTHEPKSGKFRNALSGGLTFENVDLNSVYVIAQNLIAGQPSVDSATSINTVQNRLRTKDAGLYVQDELALLDNRLSLLGGLLGERSSLNGNTGKFFLYPKLAAVYALIAPEQGGPAGNAAKRPIENLRLRAAYGEAGNRPNYGQKFTALTAANSIDGNPGLTIGPSFGDANIEPERQREIELGADVASRDQRVVAELTLYQRSISNLLLQRALATSTGFTTEFLNGGSMRNRGIEAAVQVAPVRGKVDWTTRATLTLNRSLITDLPDNIPAFDLSTVGFGAGLGAFRIEEGKSATQIVGTIGGGEVAVVGNGEPDFRVGWSNTVQVGDFTFGALIDWQQGSQIINLTRLLYDSASNSPDETAAAERLARLDEGDMRPYIEDATFVKLRELSVTYRVPEKVAKELGPVKSLSVSLSGRNLYTLTNYSGLDPEVSNFGSQPIGRNYDVAPYPPSRSFWFSVSAGL